MTGGSGTNICIGGTFSPLHRGHKVLLREAFARGDHVMVGLTGDEMASRNRTRKVEGYARRHDVIHRFLEELSKEFGKSYEIRMIDDGIGFADDASIDSIVVSSETESAVEEINSRRREKNLPPLKVFKLDMVLDQGGLKISSTRIVEGEINPDGTVRSEEAGREVEGP
ncbi:MAG: phosphopantetheine adenylyltransferase [Thermoplasmatota archaeon]